MGRLEASPDDAEQKGKPELEHIICVVAKKMSALVCMGVSGARLCFVERPSRQAERAVDVRSWQKDNAKPTEPGGSWGSMLLF